ncbi:lytic transglycosylase domain-containing protein [Rubellimicrobium rubrum]|uniref:Lytic transglycosylase domain-containing protein n=1 Tax=Rubellimicrobium rubrum TaxID=2585369 RepID=A0A5C4N4Q8_9RHOB|nr:lytic transglycosylase domain-containing protein [Rubellimicrobium rubrum]TNC52935.1 lytic transglycosylase domain-containing protein [Rubellimicrobium rubrum]
MVSSLHVARWTLGGAFAVIAGLAASAEPLAPMDPHLRSAAFMSESLLPLHLDVSAMPTVEPAQRPRARALASIPVEITVQTGAERRPEPRPVFTAEARWDDRSQGEAWSESAMAAIEEAPRDLRDIVPADIDAWCPGYERNPPHLRAAFWVGTVSALARYESNFNPQAQGGGGAWHGLLQISPATARHYGCDATSASELHDGEANLECAIRIMSRTVARDGVVAAGDRGIAADWGPMSNDKLQGQIRDWVQGQSYCEVQTAVMASLIPPVRPTAPDAFEVALLD